MERELVVAIGADRVRRDSIVRTFAASGFDAAAVGGLSEFSLQGKTPRAFVLDGLGGDELARAMAEIRTRWPDAGVWTVSEAVTRLRAGGGGYEEVFDAVLSDLSVKRSGSGGDEQIKRAKREYESILDSSPDPMFVVSDSLTILRANRAFFEKVGKPPPEVIGRHCVEFLRGILQPWGAYLLAKVLESATPLRWNVPEVALGEPYHCTTFKVVLDDEVLGVAHYLHEPETFADSGVDGATPVALDDMLAGLIHELNNPLAAVLGFAEVLEDSGSCPRELVGDLRQIQHEAWRCRRIVGNLLHMGRTPEPKRVATDVHELIERVISVRSYRREYGEVRIERSFAADLPRMMVDGDQIEQILLNLLSNAQEAMGGPVACGTIVVRTAVEGGQLAVSVADEGPGIEPDKIERVFDPFFTTKGSGKGTGLGLSVSRTLARNHGGDVEARNRAEGGAIFTLRIPLVLAENAPGL